MVYYISNETKVAGKEVINLDMIPGDGDRKKIKVIDLTPDGGLYVEEERALCSGRAVETEFFPKRLKKCSGSVMPDYGYLYRLNYVSDRFRRIVEAVEPGVHQFIPFQIVGPKKAVLADMFFMNICNRLDSVDREHTTLLLAHGAIWAPGREVPREQWPRDFDPDVAGRFVFNNSQVGDHHLWFDKHSGDGPYLSDTLAGALLQGNITGVKLQKAESV
ncbi:imm11 family protein [Agrobacterium tumefaciens]|uniref:imm11 family protein n=1 Tax=Agrobacterium tumefaciens TaxID=358 RepID=UPI00045AEEEE|nr:DUF1629 domain-containing protein [Agrobacterium tumefaciens]CDN93530.1 hypothetical protein BN949_02685 [Agrobacterium tumefaciens]